MIEQEVCLSKNGLRGANAETLVSSGMISLWSQALPEDLSEEIKIRDALRMFCSKDGYWKDGDNSLEAINFLAKSGAKYIGTLTVMDFSNIADDPWSKEVWNFLHQRANDFAERASLASGHILLASGVVVDIDWRRKGVYNGLTNQMVDELNPAVMIGTSKSPVAVEARAAVLKNRGYRTFYGRSEVTPQLDNLPVPKLLDSLRILAIPGVLYFKNESEKHTNELPDAMSIDDAGNDDLESIPDISLSNPSVKNAFQKVIDAQANANRLNQHQYIFDSLISVRVDLI